jgi:hypothetical protein
MDTEPSSLNVNMIFKKKDNKNKTKENRFDGSLFIL